MQSPAQPPSIRAFDQASSDGGSALAAASLAGVNRMLIDSERKLTNAEVCRNRPWFKHSTRCAGFYTGYGRQNDACRSRSAIDQKMEASGTGNHAISKVLQDEAALISAPANIAAVK